MYTTWTVGFFYPIKNKEKNPEHVRVGMHPFNVNGDSDEKKHIKSKNLKFHIKHRQDWILISKKTQAYFQSYNMQFSGKVQQNII